VRDGHYELWASSHFYARATITSLPILPVLGARWTF
jgi:hypothetical protein